MRSMWGFLFIWDWDPSKDFLFVWDRGSIWNLDQQGPKLAQCNFLHFQPLIMQSSWMIVVPLSISELPGKLSNSQPSWHEGRSQLNATPTTALEGNAVHWRIVHCNFLHFATPLAGNGMHHRPKGNDCLAREDCQVIARRLTSFQIALSPILSYLLHRLSNERSQCITLKLDIYYFPISA